MLRYPRGETKSCKKGSYAIGAEIGLHDAYGYSNIQQNEKIVVDAWWGCIFPMNYYLASILNVRLYCSDYTEQDGGRTTQLEGDRIDTELKDFNPTEK